MSTSTLSISRAPSPSFSRGRRSPSPSNAAPFLSPQLHGPSSGADSLFTMIRPIPRRLLSLQNPSSRPVPYPSSTPSSPNLSPTDSSSGKSPTSSTASSNKRPGAPRRSHSFCASGQNTTFALASTSSSSHLSPDKKVLVAPPLERTLSSIGSKGNQSPPSQQMQRPFPTLAGEEEGDRTPTKGRMTNSVLGEKDVNYQTTPQRPTPQTKTHFNAHPSPPVVPTILIHPSLTPPRPSLATMRTASGSSASSRSSSYTTTVMTPMTPTGLVFGRIAEDDTDETDEGEGSGSAMMLKSKREQGVDIVMSGVEDLVIE
ncbi:hypothetical protein CI109_105072 [Kwoniella shandongensis]|uniref:Uncharacterized protein n=1 Tax=Kwoniella shandongensis TaxID=1734106 RepID=A0A5M6BWL2_9TREE|nr:uncharacterized protein CI109_004328 [Kwoniella shandongensis]KAA5527268.1 hypothetical protein CI109_004328 [Kwoniella shandongensis]